MKIFILFSVIFLLASCNEQKFEISQIDFTADACYGTCPVFKMRILSDGTAHFDAERYNNKQGQFNTIIKHSELDSLKELITKSDFFNLENKYSIGSTDHPTYTLTIKLKNGKAKTVEDYGPAGPEKLKLIYTKIFSLRQSQDWK
jgi:hypothetical protein